MDGILLGKDFDRELLEAKRLARQYMFDNVRFYTVTEEGNTTTLNLFGGQWQWVIDRDRKRIYCLSPIETTQTGTATKVAFAHPLAGAKRLSESDIPLLVASKTHGTAEMFRNVAFNTIYPIMFKHMISKGMLLERECDSEALLAMQSLTAGTFEVITPQILLAQERKVKKTVVTVMNTCWGKNTPWTKVVRVIGKQLWKYLDADIAKLCLLARGRHATSEDYNLIWRHADEVKKVAAHSPSLIPIWVAVVKHKKEREPAQKMDYNNIVQTCQNYLNEMQGEGTGKRPLTKAGWRYLLRLKPLWIECLMRTRYGQGSPQFPRMGQVDISHRLGTLTDFLDLFAEVQELPSFTLFLQLGRGLYGAKCTPSLVGFLRAAFKESKKRPIKKFYEQQFSLAWDWWSQSPQDIVLDANQMRADWSWFMRQQKEWHEAVQRDSKLRYNNDTWLSLIASPMTFESSKGPLEIVPLTSTYELFDEGEAMHHCVRVYSHYCLEGHSRIFSIRKDGERLSTLEIGSRMVPDQSAPDHSLTMTIRWETKQNRSVCNGIPPDEAREAAHFVVTLYNEMWEQASPEQVEAHKTISVSSRNDNVADVDFVHQYNNYEVIGV